jgi:uncharacterized protein YndB with AHSA1/START domain
MDETVLEYEVTIAARPSTVFAYLTDGDRITDWMGSVAELDPVAGGDYHIDFTGVGSLVGEIVEVVENERLVMTWGWNGSPDIPPGSTTVEFTLTDDGDATTLRLRHSGLPAADADHDEGWRMHLPLLVGAAEAA